MKKLELKKIIEVKSNDIASLIRRNFNLKQRVKQYLNEIDKLVISVESHNNTIRRHKTEITSLNKENRALKDQNHNLIASKMKLVKELNLLKNYHPGNIWDYTTI